MDLTRVFEDTPQSARPRTALIDESIRAIEGVVMHGHQIFVRRGADELGI